MTTDKESQEYFYKLSRMAIFINKYKQEAMDDLKTYFPEAYNIATQQPKKQVAALLKEPK